MREIFSDSVDVVSGFGQKLLLDIDVRIVDDR